MNCNKKAISLCGVSKRYRIYNKSWKKLLALFFRPLQRKAQEFYALRNIDIDVEVGECVGIVGRNGAGKSTLLQLIAGTVRPSTGNVQVHGRLAALLELGSGFNPDFTGHQNILINSAVLGLSKEELKRCYDDIVAFADIGDFLHRPVRTYSSGMAMRLAFAVQIMVKPDILIIDEVLAVGDAAFQLKCLERMRTLLRTGTTVLFVSHDITLMQNFCSRIYWLDQGRLRMSGPTAHVLNCYTMDLYMGLTYRASEKSSTALPISTGLQNIAALETAGDMEIELMTAGLLNASETEMLQSVSPGESVCFALTFRIQKAVSNPHFFVCLQDRNGQRIFTLSNLLLQTHAPEFIAGRQYTLRFYFAFPPIFHGSYSFAVSAVDGTLHTFRMLHMAYGASPVSVKKVQEKNTMALFYLENVQTSFVEIQDA